MSYSNHKIINFLLFYVNFFNHSSAWPTGLVNQPEPQKDINEIIILWNFLFG